MAALTCVANDNIYYVSVRFPRAGWGWLAAIHSLRHNTTDWLLTAAPALADLASRFLGHGNGGDEAKMRKTYGGRPGLLAAKAKMLALAFPEMSSFASQDAAQDPLALGTHQARRGRMTAATAGELDVGEGALARKR